MYSFGNYDYTYGLNGYGVNPYQQNQPVNFVPKANFNQPHFKDVYSRNPQQKSGETSSWLLSTVLVLGATAGVLLALRKGGKGINKVTKTAEEALAKKAGAPAENIATHTSSAAHTPTVLPNVAPVAPVSAPPPVLKPIPEPHVAPPPVSKPVPELNVAPLSPPVSKPISETHVAPPPVSKSIPELNIAPLSPPVVATSPPVLAKPIESIGSNGETIKTVINKGKEFQSTLHSDGTRSVTIRNAEGKLLQETKIIRDKVVIKRHASDGTLVSENYYKNYYKDCSRYISKHDANLNLISNHYILKTFNGERITKAVIKPNGNRFESVKYANGMRSVTINDAEGKLLQETIIDTKLLSIDKFIADQKISRTGYWKDGGKFIRIYDPNGAPISDTIFDKYGRKIVYTEPKFDNKGRSIWGHKQRFNKKGEPASWLTWRF